MVPFFLDFKVVLLILKKRGFVAMLFWLRGKEIVVS